VKAVYVSEKGERLSASFDRVSRTVTVSLPKDRVVTLPLALSASGARYSNGRETFWEHQGEASFRIDEKPVFQGKIVTP